MQDKSTKIRLCLGEIADVLLLNGTLLEWPGLIYGKMGVAIFFFQYTRFTGNRLFENYAADLIGEIGNQIHNNSPADYANGIAGIGAGINYLIENGFIEPGEDIFEDFDKRMFRAVMYDPWQDFSLYNGLSGHGRYWIKRLYQPASTEQARACLLKIIDSIEAQITDISMNELADIYIFLYDLLPKPGFEICHTLLGRCRDRIIQSRDVRRCFSRTGDSVAGKIASIYQHNLYFSQTQTDVTDNILQQLPDLDMEKMPFVMGLLSGFAGEGMLRLTALNKTDKSWMRLL